MSKFKPGQTVFQIFGKDIVKRTVAYVITFEDGTYPLKTLEHEKRKRYNRAS